MNSNIGLFDEDRNLCFDDMEWNVDYVFTGESPPDSGFDLSKETQDFLEGGNALQTCSAMIIPSTSPLQSNSNHISPRGIADNVEQENSCDRAKANFTNAKEPSPTNPVTRNDNERNSSQYSSLSLENKLAPEATDEFAANNNNDNEITLKRTFPKRNHIVSVELGDSPIQANEEPGAQNGAESQQESDLPGEQIPSLGEDLHDALRSEITLGENEYPNEFSGADGYGANNITSDPIEALVQLPGHVRFNGDLDPILNIESMDPPVEDDVPTQELLHLQTQVPHQEVMTSQIEATHQVDLSSNVVLSNYELSANYQTVPEHTQRFTGISSIPDARLLQAQAGIPVPNNIPSPSGMHLDHQTIQEVVQAYHSNMHRLQSPLTSDRGPRGPVFGVFGTNAQSLFSTQPLKGHHYLNSAGSSHKLPHRTPERIVKKRTRKKSVRDPTKPPLTPRRRKAYNPGGKNTEPGLGLSQSGIASVMLQRNYTPNSLPQTSTAAYASSFLPEISPQSGGRPSTIVPEVPPTTVSGINFAPKLRPDSPYPQPSSRLKQKGAGKNAARANGRVDSGRVTKKTGKKGGRINPETAHLSVEERRSLRAKRNRESAEKSRVRRKAQTAELELSVAELRNENKTLKSEALRLQAHLSTLSMEVTPHTNNPAEQEQILRDHTPALFQALLTMQRVVNECPRTFRPHPHSPEIQLKIRR